MLWLTIFFMVILKIPVLYLAYVIWWAVKDPPAPELGDTGFGGIGPPRHPRRHTPPPGRRPGPHGTPARRPVRAARRLRAKRVA